MDSKIKNTTSRRQFIKFGGVALSAIPLLAISNPSHAATNASLRAAMKYQATPNDGKSCSGCMQFVPGKSPTDLGGCKLFTGDTEISPKGYCMAWTAKAK